MIKSFKHKGLQKFYETGSTKGIQAIHADKIAHILFALDNAAEIRDMDLIGFKLHCLKGDFKDIWAVTVQANWRITFKFEDKNVYIVDYLDYH
ncbi:MAG: type II toxin-antitoxin system RelE/ParE family toxin [Candidatus Gastranaerophilales bacterium]|nr:type II toxin-antitoxin system RelE/ParE family toxin [Candidatus Gastranaerophilales bacterium]